MFKCLMEPFVLFRTLWSRIPTCGRFAAGLICILMRCNPAARAVTRRLATRCAASTEQRGRKEEPASLRVYVISVCLCPSSRGFVWARKPARVGAHVPGAGEPRRAPAALLRHSSGCCWRVNISGVGAHARTHARGDGDEQRSHHIKNDVMHQFGSEPSSNVMFLKTYMNILIIISGWTLQTLSIYKCDATVQPRSFLFLTDITKRQLCWTFCFSPELLYYNIYIYYIILLL